MNEASDSSLQPKAAFSPRRPWLLLAGGFGAGVLAAILAVLVSAALKRPPAPPPPPYEVTSDTVRLRSNPGAAASYETELAELADALPHPPYTGRVATIETLTAPSFAPLSGRMVDVKVRLGDHVRQGDKLVEIRTADLAAMQHELKAARLSMKTRQAVVDRLTQLVELRAAPTHDLTVAKGELDEARFSAQAADARLRALTVAQNGETSYWILANRAGVVVQLDASPGKQTGPGSDRPVATVASLDDVLILADVDQKDVASLSLGMTAAITVPGTINQRIQANVETVSDVVDPDRQTVPVRLRADNRQHSLRPNSYVEVTFISSTHDKVLQVPSAAVVTDGDKAIVFVETQPGVLRKTPVQLGRQTRERTEIINGLAPGTRVVTRGALLLLNAINVNG